MFFYPVTYTVIAAQCKNPKSTFIQCLNEDEKKEKKTADAFFLFLVHPIQIDYVRVCVCACVRAYVCVYVWPHLPSDLPPSSLSRHTIARERERDRDSNQT